MAAAGFETAASERERDGNLINDAVKQVQAPEASGDRQPGNVCSISSSGSADVIVRNVMNV